MRPEAFHQRNTVTRGGVNLEIFSTRMPQLHESDEMFME